MHPAFPSFPTAVALIEAVHSSDKEIAEGVSVQNEPGGNSDGADPSKEQE